MTTDELIAAAKGLVKELQGRINGGGMDLHGNADSIRRPSVTRLRQSNHSIFSGNYSGASHRPEAGVVMGETAVVSQELPTGPRPAWSWQKLR